MDEERLARETALDRAALKTLVALLAERDALIWRLEGALLEARPYVFNCMQEAGWRGKTAGWRGKTAQDVLSRVDSALDASPPAPPEAAE